MRRRVCVGQIVLDRSRSSPKAAIVVGSSKRPGEVRICRWRGGVLHWSLPVSVGEEQIEPVTDWTAMPLTEAKRLATAAYERNYLARAMASAKGSVVDAARLAGVDRSNFRRLLQRHHLVKMPLRPKRRKKKTTKRKRSR